MMTRFPIHSRELFHKPKPLMIARPKNLDARWMSSIVPASENLPSKLIDFSISAKIQGEESQIAMVTLRPGETLRAESGSMLFMTDGIEMNTELNGASSAFTRMMTGQNLFLTDFTYTRESGEGTVGLGTDFPSKIVRLVLEDYEDSTVICQKGAFMASNPSVNIEMEFTKKFTAGFFGGEGFILQKLKGQGGVLVKAGGTLIERELEEGEVLRVTSGSLVGFTSTVQYDVQMIPGIKNAMFGGEGLFVTTLKGPGKIWLQGMPPDRMISEIARRVPSGGSGLGVPIFVGGSGSGGEAATEAGGEATAAASGAAGAEMASSGEGFATAATSEDAINADRQTTVATSDVGSGSMDSESPSALFGDASGKDTAATGTDESAFADDTTFSTTDTQQSDDSFWTGDQTTTEGLGSSATDSSEESSSVLSTLWNLFSSDD